MDNDGQRLLDVINDPNALESFLGDSNNAAHHNPGAEQHPPMLTTATAITQEQLASLQQQIQQQQAQLAQLQQLQQQQLQQQHFQQQAVRSPAQPQQVILRSPAGPPFPPASPSSLASSPAPSGSLGHPYSPAPAQSPGPAAQFYRAAPSPQQQRSSSLSSTPVASPINYPPGPGPGSNGSNCGGGNQQAVQLPAGTITIPGLSASTGPVQQLVSTPGGQVLQIISAPAPSSSPQLAGSPGTVNVRQTQPAVRLKQPQLRPKPANSNNNAGSSPGPAREQTSSPRMVAPVAVQQQQQQQQHVVVQQPQQQPQQQQHTTGQMVQLGAGGPTGTLVFSGPAGGNAMFPALAPTGGQFFLQPQAGGGGFQLIVRPPPAPTPPSPAQQAISSPANAQQPRQQQPATIVMQPQLGPTVLNHRPPSATQATVPHHQPTLAQPMVRLVTLPGLGTVQLQQIQTPNGPAFLAVQQPQPQQQPQPTFLRVAQPAQTTTYIQQQPQQQDTIRLVSSPATATVVTSKPAGDVASDNNTHNNSNTGPKGFASPPVKKPPAKKKPPKKKAKEVVEEKRPPVQVNLAELMKQTGIVDDDDFSFMLDDDPQPPPPQPLPTVIQPAVAIVPTVQPIQLETKENNVMQPVDGPMLSETNLIQTLHQHGLALSADDLHTLRNFIKPNSESSALMENDGSNGGINGIKEGGKPLVAGAAVSLTLSNGQVIQLTEPFEQQQQPKPPPVQFVTFAQPAPAPVEIHVQQQQQQQHHGFQNEFLEDLARSQIVSDPKKGNKNNKTTPQARTPNNNNNKKKAPPKKKNATTASPVTSASATNAVQTVVVTLAPPTTPTSTGTGPVQRVQTIKLSPQNQQNLRNIQAQIQYLNSKKDPSPQDTSLLQKLIEHHQKILATGKPVPTIPGQHAQGVPFSPSVTSSGDNSQPLPSADPPDAAARGGGAVCQGKGSVVPANIQQNVHLANLLRQPVPEKSQRVTTSTSSAPQTTTVRLLQSSSSCTTTTTTSTTTKSTIQSPIGTLVLTVVDGDAAAAASSPSGTTPVTTESATPQVGTEQQSRGIKRPAAAAAPPKASIAKSTLFEHQLKTDQSGAIAPDCHTPFKNKTNACKRLVRYHVFHELDVAPAVLEQEEEELEDKSQQLLSKFHQMINKYHHLLLMESTKEAPASEYVMVERMFVGEEKQSLERLKEEARVAKELQLTPVLPELKTEPMDEDLDPEAMAAAQAAAVEQAVNGLAEELSDQQLKIPKVATLKFTRNKEGEGYKTELREELQMDDVVNKTNCRIDMNNHSVPLNDSDFGKQPQQQHQPYDEWEAIQQELALYPESRDHKDDMDFLDGGDGIVYDEDIKAQMQNAIDDLIRLNGCDDMAASTSFDPSRQNGGDQYNSGNSEGQVDVALNEAVNSIL